MRHPGVRVTCRIDSGRVEEGKDAMSKGAQDAIIAGVGVLIVFWLIAQLDKVSDEKPTPDVTVSVSK